MPLSPLPHPDPRQLGTTHLEVAVCQIRYEHEASVSDIGTGIELHDRLGGRAGDYPRIDAQELRTAVVEVGQGSASLTSDAGATKGWRLRSADGAWTVTLMPDHASLETTGYTTWQDDFRPRLERLLGAVSELVRPAACHRVGLRYVNRLPLPPSGNMRDWAEWIRPELLGPLTHPGLMEGITSVQQQVEIDVGDGIGCLLRHGALKDAREVVAGYLLDLDVFSQVPHRFSAESTATLANDLNSTALALFQLSLTQQYVEKLRTGGDHD